MLEELIVIFTAAIERHMGFSHTLVGLHQHHPELAFCGSCVISFHFIKAFAGLFPFSFTTNNYCQEKSLPTVDGGRDLIVIMAK